MTEAPPTDVLAVARCYVENGRSVIPIGLDGNKRPAFDVLPRAHDPEQPSRFKGTWKPYQEQRPTEEELQKWFGVARPYAIALVCGKVSGGAELLDLDRKDIVEPFCEIVRAERPELYERLSRGSTPRGMHLTYLTTVREGNQTLARQPYQDGKGDTRYKALIETRGEGGYAVVEGSPPEVHETRLPYEHVGGPTLDSLRPVTDEEREYLFRLAANFDEEPKAGQKAKAAHQQSTGAGELSPGDDFDLRGDPFSELLPDARFSRPGEDRGYATRPGKDDGGTSGTVGHCKGKRGEPLLKVFTSGWHPFEQGGTYGRFQVLRLTQFNGDGAAATRSLRDRGFGSTQGRPHPGANGKYRAHGGQHEPSEQEAGKAASERYKFTDTADFRKADYRVQWFVDFYLARMQPAVMAGPSKSLKTSVLVDLAVSVATATPHLGKWRVGQRARVAMVSGESGGYALQETFFRVMRAKELPEDACDDWLKWEFSLPTFADKIDTAAFAARLAALECELVIIDPFYLTLGAVDAKNMFEMGPALKAVADLLLYRHGVTPIIAHHSNRQLPVGEPMQLQHLAYSGLEQFLAQYMFLNRREQYENDGVHRMWLTFGGRPGHSGKWILDVEEGLLGEGQPPRRWDVKVSTAADAHEAEKVERKREKAREQLEQDQDDEKGVLAVIDAEAERGFPGASKSWLGDHARDRGGVKIGDRRARAAVDRLVERCVLRQVDPFDRPSGNGAPVKVKKGFGRVPDE